jgi:hypothetical protein
MTDYKQKFSVGKFSKPEEQTNEKNDREPPRGKYADFLRFLLVPWRGWNQISETQQLTWLAMSAVSAVYKSNVYQSKEDRKLEIVLGIVEKSLIAMKAVAAKAAADSLVNESPLDWAENYSSIEDAYEDQTDHLCKMLSALKEDLGESWWRDGTSVQHETKLGKT